MADSKKSKDTSETDTDKADAEATELPPVDPLNVPDAKVAEPEKHEDASDEAQAEASDPEPAKADDAGDEGAPDNDASAKTDDADAASTSEDSSDASADVASTDNSDSETDTTGASVVEAQPDADRGPGTSSIPPVQPKVVRETVVEKRSGFVPVLLGGILAAGAGFLAAQYESNDWPFASGTPAEDPFRTQTESALASQQGSVASLTERLDAVETTLGGLDDSGTVAALDDLKEQVASLNEQASLWTDQIGLLEVRVVELEKAPIADTVSPDAIAAYERELDALRADISEQRVEIQNMATEAVAAEQNAAAQAELAKARAALAELTAALENGQPFNDSVITIEAADDVTVPDVLTTAAADGVPTLTGLADSFPDAARAGLAAARQSGADATEGNRLTGFFKAQLGARSVAPKDGDDPDAVLSRAEAAITAGDLPTALDEIATLPEPAKAAMADWIDRAELRAQAQAAADTLTQELNKQ
ncbi:mitofilin family membrane protein [Thalassococcus sp. BH17M4-6]|uniref:COG4223 family protein n=1 Tax=Thalassococcus sp. BH17M4-6 TaxID=3413148 RepID=UPI003BCE62B8